MIPHLSRREFLATATLAGAALAVNDAFAMPPLPAVILPPRNSMQSVCQTDVQRFIATLQGRAVWPGDGDYDQARELWNHAFNKRPGLIIECQTVEDVRRTVDFSVERNLLLAVRSTGHSLAGKSCCDGGLVLDLSNLKQIHVDRVTRTARVDPGVHLGDFDRATQAYGLATNSGTEVSVGISGLALGGGLGWLMGKYGLACDNLRAVDIVLADGRLVTADHEKYLDLYWAVRGAGANFGVVTSLTFDLHPVGPVLAGAIEFPVRSVRDALKHYRDCTRTLPDEIGLTTGLIPGRDGKLVLSLAVCYCGDDLQVGERWLAPLRSFRPVIADFIKPMTYVDLQELAALPPNLKFSTLIRSSALTELSDGAIDVIAENAQSAPPLSGAFTIERLHGKMASLPPTATAFPHRFDGYNFSIHADWLAPSGETYAREWGTSFWSAMQPYLRPAVYSNYLGNEGQKRVQNAYGVNYDRLASLKTRFDPDNLFQQNQNILPGPHMG